MIFTEKVIRECLAKGITDKQAIARELIKQDNSVTLDQARARIRSMLGASGRPVAEKNTALYELYRKATQISDHYENASKKGTVPASTYIITTALNNTPVHRPFWENILKYAEFLGAQVHVIAARYKNPTSVFTDRDEDVWCQDVLPYLDAARHELFPGIHLMSDVKISPTAVTPLSGLNGLSGPESCIFGHPRVHMQFMPVPKGSDPKIMMTTGVCTLPNYTDSKAGKKGAFHHTYGFVIATESEFHYVKANANGDFIDYHNMVTSDGISEAPPPKALVLGDIHVAKLTKRSKSRIRARIQEYDPETIILHDVLDCESVNPHTEKNALDKFKRFYNSNHDLSNEIEDTLNFLKDIMSLCPNVVLVPGNHEDMLDRYIANMDWKKDIANAMKYAELLPIALKEESVFAYLAKQIGINATSINDSVRICGIELNIHGDKGANGSKGSSVQYKNMPFKMIKGHDHTPSCFDGCVSVGCQDLDHGYNNGLSSWGIGDAIINADGKTQHLL